MTLQAIGSARKYGKRIFFIIIAIIISIGTAQLINQHFSIEHVEIIGKSVNISIDEKKLPNNLLFFPSVSVIRSILSENSMIERVQIEKKYPHTLVIHVSQRTPFVKLLQNDEYIEVDRTGFVLGASAGKELLPVVTFPVSSVIIGSRVTDEKFMHVLAFLEKTKEIISFDYLDEYDSASFRAVMGQTDIIIPQQEAYERITTTLQTLMTGFRIKGTLPKTIDLRFDKPIVTF